MHDPVQSVPDISKGKIMDIRCPKCCEPWEIDTVHDYVAEFGEIFPDHAATVTFQTVYRDFRRYGCGVAFQAWNVSCEPDSTGRAEIIGMLADVLGDDVDGFASMLDDLNHMGGVL